MGQRGLAGNEAQCKRENDKQAKMKLSTKLNEFPGADSEPP